MRQINHSLNRQDRWQRKNRDKQIIYNDRYHTKHLVKHCNGSELEWVMSLINERLKPLGGKYVMIPLKTTENS